VTRVAIERLPGLLGHELRNPLAAAMTGALLVRELTDADDPRAALLDGVLADLRRAVDLTDGWLAVARGRAVGDGEFALAGVLAAVAARHGADLVTCPEDVTVAGNAAMVERAVANLCENSVRAGATHVRIAAQAAGDEIAIHVEDNGAGVAPADVDRIFTAGWSSRGGAGLGLHAVAATASAHRGSIRCVPMARGTRFTLTLPTAGARAVHA
jgi:signal transduction histidine kinase